MVHFLQFDKLVDHQNHQDRHLDLLLYNQHTTFHRKVDLDNQNEYFHIVPFQWDGRQLHWEHPGFGYRICPWHPIRWQHISFHVGDRWTGLGDRVVGFLENRPMVFQVQQEQYHCYRELGNRIEDELFRVRILSFLGTWLVNTNIHEILIKAKFRWNSPIS